MSGGSQPSGTQVIQQSSGPWAGQQPYLSDAFKIARQQLATDAAKRPAYYPGLTYTPMTGQTAEGIVNLRGRALSAGTNDAIGAERAMATQAQGLLSSGARAMPGYTQQGASGAALSAGARGLPGYNALAETAGGGMLGRNPELQGAVSRAFDAARPSIDSAFASSGRLGSGAYANAIADTGQRIAGDIYYQDYGRERQNQLGAAQQLAGNDIAARQAGANIYGNLGAQDLAARGLGGQLAQQSVGNDRQSIQDLLTVGGLQEGYADKALTERINRWNATQNRPWDQLGRYMSIIQGNYGTEGSTIQPVYGNPALSSVFGGLGALGGLASGAGSLITALSDARAKEDIRPVGQLDNGLPVYAYRYKGDPTPQIGLLAQEVAAVRPDAVAMRPDGLLGVNYDRATA